MAAKAAGHGWSTIAARLGRPAFTVRTWLRRARGEHADWLYHRGVARAAALNPEVLNHTLAADTILGEALTALAAAVTAWQRRFADRVVAAWTVIGVFTSDRRIRESAGHRPSTGTFYKQPANI